MFLKFVYRFLLPAILVNHGIAAQSIEQIIEPVFSHTTIHQHEILELKIPFKEEKIKNVSSLPLLHDWVKLNTSFKKENKIWYITQYYKPLKYGTYLFQDFQLYINQKKYIVKGINIRVLKNNNHTEPKKDTLPQVEPNLYNGNLDARLKLEIEENKIYKTEYTRLRLKLIVGEKNDVEINFFNLKEQLKTISDAFRSNNLWVETISKTEEIVLDTTQKNKKENSFILLDWLICPLDTGKFNFFSTHFTIISYQTFKSQNIVYRNYQFKDLTSNTLTLNSIAPPKLENWKGNIGKFNLSHSNLPANLQIGKAYKFYIKISADQKHSNIEIPKITNDKKFQLFKLSSEEKKQIGEKKINILQINYAIVPQDTGEIKLDNKLYWVYFNTQNQTLDTLSAFKNRKFVFLNKIQGNNLTNHTIDKHWQELFDKSSNRLINLEQNTMLKYISNTIIILMLIGTLYLIFKK
jgi:hypothetical protein